MTKLKNLIHKIKASIYGAAGRAQLAADTTEAVEPQVVEPEPEPEPLPEPKPEPVAKPVKKAVKKASSQPQSSDVAPAKKPGRPKGSGAKPQP